MSSEIEEILNENRRLTSLCQRQSSTISTQSIAIQRQGEFIQEQKEVIEKLKSSCNAVMKKNKDFQDSENQLLNVLRDIHDALQTGTTLEVIAEHINWIFEKNNLTKH